MKTYNEYEESNYRQSVEDEFKRIQLWSVEQISILKSAFDAASNVFNTLEERIIALENAQPRNLSD